MNTQEQQRIRIARLLPDLLYVEESNTLPKTIEEAITTPIKTTILWKDAELIRDWYPVKERDWLWIIQRAVLAQDNEFQSKFARKQHECAIANGTVLMHTLTAQDWCDCFCAVLDEREREMSNPHEHP